jgi:UDP-2-acetamido-2-deoxy-ribo-hexuluronate aminotransferase
VQLHLKRHGIETRIHYAAPLHEESAYSHITGPGLLSRSSALSRRVLSLPIYPELTDSEVEHIIDRVLAHV